VIQPEDAEPEAEPELISLRLNQGAFEAPEPLFPIGLFFPLELRHVRGGVVAASDDSTNFLFFWPESPDRGVETAFRPSAYLSSSESFVAELDDNSGAILLPIGNSLAPVDTVPDCPTLLAWLNGPDPSSLAGSKIACLVVQEAVATITVHSYDAKGARTAIALDDEALRTGFVATPDWEAHARGFAPGGGFLALASGAHDALIDLRGSSPKYQTDDVAAPGNTARGFSPSGRYLLQQRGQHVDFVVLAPSEIRLPLRYELPDAAIELASCTEAHHSRSWCGAPSAARGAGGRWSFGSDVAALLTASEGLAVIVPTTNPVAVNHLPVSTCGTGCVTQYEFGR
jgi:hypothetical protein